MSNRTVPVACPVCKKDFFVTVSHFNARKGKCCCSQGCAKTVDLTGKVFGFLSVIAREGVQNTFVTWRVACTCGAEKVVNGHELRRGSTKSCGCKTIELTRPQIITHGMKHTRTWRSWEAMRGRCLSEGDPSYERYGGRGIRICGNWATFEAFFEDLGERPPNTTLDRRDNNGNYSCGKCPECIAGSWPANCHWATRKEQERNKRSTHWITINGDAQPLVEWIARSGLSESTVHGRLKRGWSPEKALTTPAISGGRPRRSNPPV